MSMATNGLEPTGNNTLKVCFHSRRIFRCKWMAYLASGFRRTKALVDGENYTIVEGSSKLSMSADVVVDPFKRLSNLSAPLQSRFVSISKTSRL